MISRIFNGKLLIFVACIMLAIIVFTGTAGAATLTVDDSGGADYMSIQAAINAANNGDTILVYSGTYYENVNVNKQLVLRGFNNGTGMPVLDGSTLVPLTISADGTTIDGFIVQNGTDPYTSPYGLRITSSNNIIRNNTATSNGIGIYLSGGSNNNVLSNNILLDAYGIFVDVMSNNNVLSNNTATSNGIGGIGIFLQFSSNNIIRNNTATSYGVGIYLSGFNNTNNSLNNNIASSNGIGIYLEEAHNNVLSNNTVSLSTGYGIYLESSNTNNLIYNNIFNNTVNLFREAGSYGNNTWNTSVGNFWAHPNGTGFSQTCIDANRDGICDSPYTIGGNNTDYLPLSMNFTVTYNFLGILPPIRTDGSSIFKLGSTVPVKFRITDANGNYVSTAIANLTYQKITDDILGTTEEAVSTSAANEGNTFRYDSKDSLYIFNLGTKGMDAGTYQLNINLDDGTTHVVRISLR